MSNRKKSDPFGVPVTVFNTVQGKTCSKTLLSKNRFSLEMCTLEKLMVVAIHQHEDISERFAGSIGFALWLHYHETLMAFSTQKAEKQTYQNVIGQLTHQGSSVYITNTYISAVCCVAPHPRTCHPLKEDIHSLCSSRHAWGCDFVLQKLHQSLLHTQLGCSTCSSALEVPWEDGTFVASILCLV